METYAFLPREAVTAFLMGCPQCSTNNPTSASAIDASVDHLQQTPISVTNAELFHSANEQWSSSTFACSTPVKQNEESSSVVKTDSGGALSTVAIKIATGADKENFTDNECHITVVAETKYGNKRKRTVPLKRNIRQPCKVVEVTTAANTTGGNSSSGSSTLKNSSNSSCTLILSSSSSSLSSRTESCSGISRSSGGWWSKWGVCSNGSRLSVSVGGSDFSGANSNMQPLDLSSSPLLTVSPTQTTIRSSSSPSVVTDDFFYKRKRVRRRRVRPKRLNRPSLGYRGGHYEDEDTTMSDRDGEYEVVRNSYRGGGNDDVGSGVNEEVDGSITDEQQNVVIGEKIESRETDEEDDGPKPAKMQRRMSEGMGDRKNNNNDEDYYDKVASVVTSAVKTTVAAISCCIGDNGQKLSEDAVSKNLDMEILPEETSEIKEGSTKIYGTEVDESDKNQVRKYTYNNNIHTYNHISRTIFNNRVDKIYHWVIIINTFQFYDVLSLTQTPNWAWVKSVLYSWRSEWCILVRNRVSRKWEEGKSEKRKGKD